MKLVTHTQLNRAYFKSGSRPARKFWMDAVNDGTINGRIIQGVVYVDEVDFLSRDNLDKPRIATNDDSVIDLLA
ncbi:hypothetical protein [Marinagarivorans algicola]|uniref:hypothetical protein n=1 Tax=Marinagarivorans algicola TaxID=1513270 RepID=UPI0006B5C585|nr:hypothetical protein [Marinagarivorans algicola]